MLLIRSLYNYEILCRDHAKHLCKGSWGPKCPSVVPFEILHSEGPFEVTSFEHFGLERHFNMAAMIVFTPKCTSEGDISRLERTVRVLI